MKLAIVFLLLALTACATTYQAEGFTGGFSETALAPDTYKILFRGT